MNAIAKRALVLMNLGAFCSGMVFYAPVATLYRQVRGLDLAQIAFVEAIGLVLTLGLELPWGHLADRIGYRVTLIVSFLLLFLSKIVFFSAHSFSLFVVERVLLAVANSAASGVDVAYLARFDSRQRTFGLYQGCQFAGLVAVALVFPFLPDAYDDSALLTIFSNALAFVWILLLPHQKVSPRLQRHVPLKFCLKRIWEVRPFLLFVSSVSLLFAVNQIVTVFLVQVCYTNVGLPVSAFGYPFLGLVVVSAAASVSSARITGRLGKRETLVLFFSLSFFGVLLLAWQRDLGVVLLGVFALRFSVMVLYPLAVSLEARQAEGPWSATILSVYAVVGEGIELLLTLLLGIVADVDLTTALLLAGLFVLVGLAGLLGSRRFPVVARWLS